jgi:hypothetical protein
MYAVLPVILIVTLTAWQQEPDLGFDAAVARPAYTAKHPRVVIDEAHNNFHTATGRYKPFASLLTNDGYTVAQGKTKFDPNDLKGYDILVIANALGASLFDPNVEKPAFTDKECEVVEEWVRNGGSLLLIADHAPIGGANEILARRFGVEMSKLHTIDTAHADLKNGGNEGWLIYSRDNELLGDHWITRGRDASEKIKSVTTFTGQSLKGPEGSTAFLKLADTAGDIDVKTRKEVSAKGRAQGIALLFGKGRVVVLGEAAMMTAQLAGPDKLKFGMNREGNDNKQLALNIMHWLSRLIDQS